MARLRFIPLCFALLVSVLAFPPLGCGPSGPTTQPSAATADKFVHAGETAQQIAQGVAVAAPAAPAPYSGWLVVASMLINAAGGAMVAYGRKNAGQPATQPGSS